MLLIINMSMVTLMDDEFAPSKCKSDIDFWQLPKGVANCNQLSWGARLLYGVIFGHAYKTGEARPSYKALQKWVGNPSKATIQRLIKELVDARLIRTIQRGRGTSNLYHLLKSPLVGNMTEEEFAAGLNFVYAGSYTEDPVLVDELTAIQYYYCELRDWVNKSIHPDDYPMPKRYFKMGAHEMRAREDARWEVIDRYLFKYDIIQGVEFEIEGNPKNSDDNENTSEWVNPDDRD